MASNTIYSMPCLRKKGKVMFTYTGTIAFQSDTELTPQQLAQIIFAIEVQMQEPADADGNDEEFSTSNVMVALESVGA